MTSVASLSSNTHKNCLCYRVRETKGLVQGPTWNNTQSFNSGPSPGFHLLCLNLPLLRKKTHTSQFTTENKSEDRGDSPIESFRANRLSGSWLASVSPRSQRKKQNVRPLVLNFIPFIPSLTQWRWVLLGARTQQWSINNSPVLMDLPL